MAKRFTDTEIWKKQRWFKQLSPFHKLAFMYIKDSCNHAGIWKIDIFELLDDTGLESLDIHDFIKSVNIDYDCFTGEKTERDRLIIIENKYLWLTGYIQYHWQKKNLAINPEIPAVKTALELLDGLHILDIALQKSYVTLTKPLQRGIDKDNNNINNKKIQSKEETQIVKQYPDVVIELTDYFCTQYQEHANDMYIAVTKKDTDKTLENWRDTFDKLLRLDKQEPDVIKRVIDALFEDGGQFREFWIDKGNLRTANKFRNNLKDGSMKVFDFLKLKLNGNGQQEEHDPTPKGVKVY